MPLVELIAVIVMLIGGGVIAAFVMLAVSISRREGAQSPLPGIPERDLIAASLLFRVLTLGGASPEEALRDLRRVTGVAVPVTSGVDVTTWGERFAALSSEPQREGLLDLAVRLAANHASPIPLVQYVALLDLSFSLGFRTDALARLRERYGFDYIDPAKAGRPREADRAGGVPLFSRGSESREELLALLEIEGTPDRRTIIAAYRKVAARHHPDRVHGASDEEKAGSAARFIQITRAYETLLAIYRD